MKRPEPPAEHTRLSGIIRHYHRSGAQAPRTWDDWVEGTTAKARSKWKWSHIVGITFGVVALSGIAIGLIIELG